MQFVQFPNGNLWRVGPRGEVVGSLRISGFGLIQGDRAREAAVAWAATGDDPGLTDISYEIRGNVVAFEARVVLPERASQQGYRVLDTATVRQQPDVFSALFQQQYGLSAEEATHALQTLEVARGAENVLSVENSGRQLHSPAGTTDDDYVRVTLNGLEVAFWANDDWQATPGCVTETLLCSVAIP